MTKTIVQKIAGRIQRRLETQIKIGAVPSSEKELNAENLTLWIGAGIAMDEILADAPAGRNMRLTALLITIGGFEETKRLALGGQTPASPEELVDMVGDGDNEIAMSSLLGLIERDFQKSDAALPEPQPVEGDDKMDEALLRTELSTEALGG